MRVNDGWRGPNVRDAGADTWNTAASPMLCRQASDGGGADELAAYFFLDETRIVF
jgi:hypothetical protein